MSPKSRAPLENSIEATRRGEQPTDFRETLVRRKQMFRGKAVSFRVDHIRLPNGKTAVREYLDHPGAVAVIPLLAPDRVVLVRQYRYPVGRLTWEIPAGKLDPKESPLRCVRRELEEETGYTAGHIKKLLSFWPTPAFANEVIHIFVADHLKPGTARPDEDEFLAARAWPLKKILKAIQTGAIMDSKTVIALLAYTTLR